METTRPFLIEPLPPYRYTGEVDLFVAEMAAFGVN